MGVEPIPMDDYARRHVLLVSRERDRYREALEEITTLIAETNGYVLRGEIADIALKALADPSSSLGPSTEDS